MTISDQFLPTAFVEIFRNVDYENGVPEFWFERLIFTPSQGSEKAKDGEDHF